VQEEEVTQKEIKGKKEGKPQHDNEMNN